MIHRDRNKTPENLLTLHDAWISKLLLDNNLSSLAEWNRVRSHQGIIDARESLVSMYDGKCCYCEHKSTSHPIEHYIPHSRNPHQLFDYSNLHLICTSCNGHKSNKDVNDVIDSSKEEPKDHITFSSENIVEITPRGKSTINKVKLDDSNLVILRQGELRKVERDINKIVELLQNSKNPDTSIPIEMLNYLKDQIKYLKEDNLSLSSQFSRMFEVNFKDELDQIELNIDSLTSLSVN